MMDIVELAAQEKRLPSLGVQRLEVQRLELQLRLQLNRRLLVHKFSEAQVENHFPRSNIMRFLTQQTTLHILKKIAFSAIGIRAFKSIQYGFSLWQFARHNIQKSHR